ncbi:uncharacterized protein METZ01_LOCUS384853, partial [marine metagenome]
VLTMVSFPDAIRLGFQHYFDFRSRSTRAEYWWWVLFVILTQQALNVVNIRIGILFGLAVLIPGLALGTRRLHNINKSGWWLLMWFGIFLIRFGIFLIAPVIVLIVWHTKPSDEGTNKYGPDPRQAT